MYVPGCVCGCVHVIFFFRWEHQELMGTHRHPCCTDVCICISGCVCIWWLMENKGLTGTHVTKTLHRDICIHRLMHGCMCIFGWRGVCVERTYVTSKFNKPYPKIKKTSKNHPKMLPKWSQNGPKMIPGRVRMGSCSGTHPRTSLETPWEAPGGPFGVPWGVPKNPKSIKKSKKTPHLFNAFF